MSANKTGLVPLVGARIGIWFRALSSNGPIPLKFWGRVVLVTLVVFIGAPFRWFERLVLNKKLRNQKIKAPVFILGHWRSGTTHLHNLMTLDDRFGYLSYLQGLFPLSFYTNPFFKKFMQWIIPEKRPMDNMKMSVKATQEEELPMAATSGTGNFMGWYFPKRLMQHYLRWVAFEDATSDYEERWSSAYMALLQKTTLIMKGRQLVLKNPPNTRRVRKLLELFPDAKFIHIYRNPTRIYASALNMYLKALPFFQLQCFEEKEIQKTVFDIYEDMMRSYLQDRNLIPKGNLIEVKFEDLEKDPLGEMRQIYEVFDLQNFADIRPVIESYLSEKKHYKKNAFKIDPVLRLEIERRFAFAFAAFGYDMEPSPSKSTD